MAKITEVKGWTLNGEVPTGETIEIEWNGKKIPTSVKEFNFMKLNERQALRSPKVIVWDTSEFGAWEQLRNILQVEGE
ncbi:hypothetical protein LSG23_20610 (plasmid) [Bacillus velezensis]|uniref:hypothetical protein n=1 Tax=Bacillus velezensis TaxID=492670 RepID=UPI000987EEB5|nr:hypothetical protein [Bacillus velezensis]AQS42479.1 hypothetical protein BVH55_00350 [Bacillus velezensis]WNR83188.1 hypothetical protein RP314_20720 [Bacillus velezensis]